MPEEMPELMEQLIELAATEVPASRVDTALAIRIGHGRRRRRRFAMGTAAAALALGVGGLAALPAIGHGNQVTPAMSASEPVTDTAPASPTNPYFAAASMPADSTDPEKYVPALGGDPLVAEATFGWLPDWAVSGSSGKQTESSYQGILTTVTGTSAKKPDGSAWTPRLSLRLYPAGITPPLPAKADGLPAPQLQQADPVDGREAYWVGGTGAESDLQLQWLTGTGRWASLDGLQMPDGDPRAVLHQVAENVRPVAEQIPLPLWFSDLPPDFKLSATTLFEPNQDNGYYKSLRLTFTGRGEQLLALIQPLPPAQDSSTPSAGSTPATPPGQTCGAGNGLQICFITLHAGQLMAEIGSADLLTHFHLLGADPRTWTTWVQR